MVSNQKIFELGGVDFSPEEYAAVTNKDSPTYDEKKFAEMNAKFSAWRAKYGDGNVEQQSPEAYQEEINNRFKAATPDENGQVTIADPKGGKKVIDTKNFGVEAGKNADKVAGVLLANGPTKSGIRNFENPKAPKFSALSALKAVERFAAKTDEAIYKFNKGMLKAVLPEKAYKFIEKTENAVSGFMERVNNKITALTRIKNPKVNTSFNKSKEGQKVSPSVAIASGRGKGGSGI